MHGKEYWKRVPLLFFRNEPQRGRHLTQQSRSSSLRGTSRNLLMDFLLRTTSKLSDLNHIFQWISVQFDNIKLVLCAVADSRGKLSRSTIGRALKIIFLSITVGCTPGLSQDCWIEDSSIYRCCFTQKCWSEHYGRFSGRTLDCPFSAVSTPAPVTNELCQDPVRRSIQSAKFYTGLKYPLSY